MALSELTRKQIERLLSKYCRERLSAYLHDDIRLGFKFRANSVTLYEERPAFAKPGIWAEMPVAQFRFQPKTREWVLYYPDRNSKWHEYAGPTRNFETLLKEVHEDPTAIFWG